MYLIQILIPIYDNAGNRFGRETFDALRTELLARFGGLTAFVQSPALGLWTDAESGTTGRDDMILVEVMTESLDRVWWADYRSRLEQSFRQDEIVVRVLGCERI
ncbi:MAG: hypothetical protein ACYC5S_00240 [Thiobacillus sp.]